MNRAQKRRQQKLARRAAKNRKRGRPAEASDLQDLIRKGAEAHQAGNLPEAEVHYRKVVEADPENFDANHLLGVVLLQTGNHQAGIGFIGKALDRDPDHPEALHNMGKALQEAGRPEEAEKSYGRALAIKPDYVEAHNNLGNALKDLGRLEDAAASFHKALAIAPDFPEAHNNLGLVLQKLERLDEAAASYRKALAIKPDFAEALNNLGNAFKDLGRLEDAVASYQKAIAINPEYAEALNNLGLAFNDTGRFEESVKSCRRAVELDPGFADAHTNLALALFQLGRLREGWEEYEWRWGSQGHRSPARAFPQPRWDGSSLEGKKIILWGEQGLGDEVRYAGMIPDLLDKGAAVSMECAERLVGLFARSFEGADVHAAPYGAAERGEREYDFQCSFPSLGRFLRPTLEAFRRDGGYLVADPERRDFWQKRLAGLSGRPKVGIIWRGQLMDQGRSKFYATIKDLAPILTLPGVDFVNLMYDECDEERAEALELYGVPIHTWDDLDLKDDLDGVAALISGLDLAVCCLSTPGELAGALGVPTLTFLAQKSHFMMLGTADTAWHPSARYFTKQLRDPWGPVFEDLARSVKQRLGL